MSRKILLLGGAPRLVIDAVRYISVEASGRTAVYLYRQLHERFDCQLLLSTGAQEAVTAQRYQTRDELDAAVDAWLQREPDSLIVLSAAVNDYQIEDISIMRHGEQQRQAPGAKIPSGAEALDIHLRPAPKLADSLRQRGHRGPLVLCKYEDAATVIESAQDLRQRCDAVLVLANSLCGRVQALVDAEEVSVYDSRDAVLEALTRRLAQLADV